MNSLVSIIMPSYNTGDYIADSIKSVIGQSYCNWELLIVDDCSTDNTDAAVKTFLLDPRIRYIKNDRNYGAAYSRNKAIREAKGKWIAFLDSDDLWLPDKLQKQISFMNNNGYSFTYTDYSEIDQNGNETGVFVSGPKKINRKGFFNYCWPGCLTVMYDTETVGLVQIAEIKKNNDYAMWLTISEKADCYLLDEDLARYRRGRSGSVSSHGVFTMIGWHYKLFRYAEQQSVLYASISTCRNLVFGLYKKIRYTKNN